MSNMKQNERFPTMVERRMKEWERNKNLKPLQLGGRGGPIDYITISRQMGSGGEEIAQKLADLMDWGLFDKKLVDFMAENFGVHKDVLATVDESTRGWIEESLNMFFSTRKGSQSMDQYSYYKHLVEAMLVIARHGRAVIVGRGAGHVLPRDKGLSIRIISPFELRCERVAREQNISSAEAATIIRKADSDHMRFLKDFVWKEPDEMRDFDLVINTEKFSPDSMAKLIWRAFDKRVDSKLEQEQMKAEGIDIARVVERHMEEWKEEQGQIDNGEAIHLSDGLTIENITVGRFIGAGGEEVAQMMADVLGWQYYDQEILNYMSENMKIHVKVLETVDERTKGWIENRLIPLFSRKPETIVNNADYLKALGETLMVIAEHCEVVILGRGAGLFLPPEKGFRVFITAPHEVRARRYARTHEIRVEDAETQLKNSMET